MYTRQLKRLGQGRLNLALATNPTTCKTCGMNYYSYMEKDNSIHRKYHDTFVNGPRCDLEGNGSNNSCREFRILLGNKSMECRMYCVNKNSLRLVKRIETLLDMVNRELNAPAGSEAWKIIADDSVAGHAFVAVIEKRIVGLCVTEPIHDTAKQARWMLDRTQEVVPKQVNNRAKVGISRIWVAPKWRRHGIAQQLLGCVLTALIFAMTLQKHDIAFSQPSFAGGKLARQFNGVKHKSGETLIPVYLEE